MIKSMRILQRLTLCAAAIAAGCAGPQEPAAAADQQQLPADKIMTGVNHSITVDGVRSALGQFDTVFVYDETSTLRISGVEMEMYSTIGSLTGTLTSRAGELNQATNAMVARDNVRLVLEADSSIIETEELHYDPNTHRVWSTVTTTRRKDDCVLTADGFTADDQFRRIEYDRQRGCVPGIQVQF